MGEPHGFTVKPSNGKKREKSSNDMHELDPELVRNSLYTEAIFQSEVLAKVLETKKLPPRNTVAEFEIAYQFAYDRLYDSGYEVSKSHTGHHTLTAIQYWNNYSCRVVLATVVLDDDKLIDIEKEFLKYTKSLPKSGDATVTGVVFRIRREALQDWINHDMCIWRVHENDIVIKEHWDLDSDIQEAQKDKQELIW